MVERITQAVNPIEIEERQTRQGSGRVEDAHRESWDESWLWAACIAARNLILGGNLASFRLLANPRAMISYVTESLFLYGLMVSAGDLPQVQVWKGLGLPSESGGLRLVIYPDAAEEWFRAVPSYAVDLVALCTLCQIVRPRVAFEIGTLEGSGALHLAANSPEAQVYTLDLGSADRPSLATTV